MHLKLASIVKYQSTNESPITIFTDSPPSEDPAIRKGVDARKALNLIIEKRKIKCLEAAEDVGVNVVLEDGERFYMGFLVHKPVTTLVAVDLVNHLGVETKEGPISTTYQEKRADEC